MAYRDTWTVSEAAAITRLTPKQLRTLDNQSVVSASARDPVDASWRRYTFMDLVLLRAVRKLREENISAQRVRRAFAYLRRSYPNLGDNLRGFAFVAWGGDVIALAPGDQFPVSAVRSQGQRVLRISLEDVRREVVDAVAELAQAV